MTYSKKPAENIIDCAYEAQGMRCKYPGAVSRGILGGGPWYCRIHIRGGGNAIAWQCLEHSQQYRKRAEPKIDDDLSEFTWLTEHYPMPQNVTPQEYNKRCRDFALSALKGFKPKSVLSSFAPQRMREPGED